MRQAALLLTAWLTGVVMSHTIRSLVALLRSRMRRICAPARAPASVKRDVAAPVVFVSSRDPPVERDNDSTNQPEKRRELILVRLGLFADVERVKPDDGRALDGAADLRVISRARLDFLRSVHSKWDWPNADAEEFVVPGARMDSGVFAKGLRPFFFVRQPAELHDCYERRLAWHATDSYTPVFDGLANAMADDAAVCARAAEFVRATGRDAYALTTHPGHHASADHYGGYCFLNHAVLIARSLRERGMRPFVVDTDFHAGDGTALLFRDEVRAEGAGEGADEAIAARFASLHAEADYPYLPSGERCAAWAVPVEANTPWVAYEGLLRRALARAKIVACNVLVISLGYDTLAGDPDACEGKRLALAPADFGAMRAVLRESGLPMVVVQEGGYLMEEIADAAEAFWRRP